MLKLFRNLIKSSKDPLQDLLDGYELPCFSSTVMSVLGMLRNPESAMEDIASQIEIDPGVHVKVLRVVNSAAFGLSTKVTSLPHAIMLLGRSRLESLLLSVVVKDTIPAPGPAFFDESNYWLACARRASLARILARHLHPPTQSESFTAGLLQDIAVPVLMASKGNDYNVVYTNWKEKPDTELHVIEQDAFGYDHATVGAMMVAQWDLPERLADAIAAHHTDSEEDKIDPAVKLVSYIRDDDQCIGTETFSHACSEQFGLTPEWLDETIQTAFLNADEFFKMLHAGG